MAGEELVCKYDADHGTYGSPIQLGRHYSESHPEHRANDRRVKCTVPGCYSKVNPENMAKHVAFAHPPSAEVVPAPRAKKPPPPEPVAWNPKQVVVPVVRELFGEQVPTDSLGEVIDFAEATRRLIERSQQ